MCLLSRQLSVLVVGRRIVLATFFVLLAPFFIARTHKVYLHPSSLSTTGLIFASALSLALRTSCLITSSIDWRSTSNLRLASLNNCSIIGYPPMAEQTYQ